MTGVLGIALSLVLLMWLAYRGITVLLLAPLLALLAVLLDGDVRLLATYTQVFMAALGGFVIRYFPLFLLGAIFGRLMNDSGSAEAIARAIVARVGARRAITAVVMSCAVLTYGGVSVFVVAFAVYPIADTLFRQAQIPKRLIPAAIVLGAATFTMTAAPGTPSIQNALPMPYFGTDLFAAPAMGLVASVLMSAPAWPGSAIVMAARPGRPRATATTRRRWWTRRWPSTVPAGAGRPAARARRGGGVRVHPVGHPGARHVVPGRARFGRVTIDEVRGV